jgi:hypothetical protein
VNPRISLQPAEMMRPGRERWSWRVTYWYADDPDHVIAQGVEDGIDAAWTAARRAVVEPSSLVDQPDYVGMLRDLHARLVLEMARLGIAPSLPEGTEP